MRMILVALLLGCGWLAASTIEVVRLFQPLSLHGTDGAGEEDESGEFLQAAVMARPFAVGGAVPEDLVKAVGSPCEIGTNSPGYEVQEANLLVICGIGLEVRFDDAETLVVTFDLAELEMPEEIDLTVRQVLSMSIRAVRRTLESYFSHGEESLAWKVVIAGTTEGNASLKDMGGKFRIGPDKKEGEEGEEGAGGGDAAAAVEKE